MIPRHQIISLTGVKGVGPRRIRNLLRNYPGLDDVTGLSKPELCRIDGISTEIAGNILAIDESYGRRALENITKIGGQYHSYWDEEYPELLKTIFDAPVGIFTLGEIPTGPAIAIVGTRRLTAYGRKMAEKLTAELVKAGLTIASGMASGVDTVCHRTAIREGGNTLAVLGNGVDVCYPAANRELRDSIIHNGALISEFNPGTRPDAPNFPRRNRIISGMSLGTLVIEAGQKSGALITAYDALDQNREVFALPGRADSKQSTGCHHLIQRGAKLVMTVNDILEELNIGKRPRQVELMPELTPGEMEIYNLLSSDPIPIDDLCLKLQKDTPEVLAALLLLELKNVVVQLPGKMFIRA